METKGWLAIIAILAALTVSVQAQETDGSFNPLFNDVYGTVYAMAVQPDGKILVGGDFRAVDGVARNNLARLNRDGTLDQTFDPGVSLSGPGGSTTIYAVAIQPDGKILVGGHFRAFGGMPRNNLTRLDSDGKSDMTFNPNVNGTICAFVYSLTVQPDGKILVGGYYKQLGGVASSCLTRLNTDGSLDHDFAAGTFSCGNEHSGVNAVAVQPDGKILVGGWFSAIGGVSRNCIARLNNDGSLDMAFNPNANDYVYSLVLQPDGTIFVGGYFTKMGGVSRVCLARLDADGKLDAAFNPGIHRIARDNMAAAVYAMAAMSNGKILVGGNFTMIGGMSRNNLAHFNPDGSLDMTFSPHTDGNVYSLAVLSDGKILAGGLYSVIGGMPRQSIARLQPK